MSEKKPGTGDYRDYWLRAHSAEGRDLAAVCFPGKPLWLNRFFDRIQRHALRRALRDAGISPAGRRLLDLGCGRGRWLDFFGRGMGARATGLDVSPEAVRACREKGFDAREGSIEELPFPDGSFDLVTSVTVLLHLPPAAKRRAVAEAARVLAPGGSALLIESTWDDPAEHVFGQPVEAWRVLWEQAGLRLAHLSGHCFILGRRALRPNGKVGDFAALCLDYPLDYLLMAANRGRRSALALQHVMVFTRPAGAGA